MLHFQVLHYIETLVWFTFFLPCFFSVKSFNDSSSTAYISKYKLNCNLQTTTLHLKDPLLHAVCTSALDHKTLNSQQCCSSELVTIRQVFVFQLLIDIDSLSLTLAIALTQKINLKLNTVVSFYCIMVEKSKLIT